MMCYSGIDMLVWLPSLTGELWPSRLGMGDRQTSIGVSFHLDGTLIYMYEYKIAKGLPLHCVTS